MIRRRAVLLACVLLGGHRPAHAASPKTLGGRPFASTNRTTEKLAPAPTYGQALELAINERLEIFKNAGPEGDEFLARTAFDTRFGLQTRWRAVTTMGRVSAERFKPELLKALRSPDWFMRNAALIALLNVERIEAIKLAQASLTDPALVVRTQAVRNLIALDARQSEAALWRELYARKNFSGKQSLWIRAHIAEALAKFAHSGERINFARMLDDRDARLHRWAVDGLERATGLRLSERNEPTDLRRQKWLARLEGQAI